MRHLLLLSLLIGAAPAAPAQPPPQVSATRDSGPAFPLERCRDRARSATGKAKGVAPRRLGELPPADLMLAVYRTENGCPVPTVVRHGIGR